MQPIFITGIGTGVGKTIVSAIVTEALEADYWKPVQAGEESGTDSRQVQSLISNKTSIVHPEVYKLTLPASPHIAARAESKKIDIDTIIAAYEKIQSSSKRLVIEGAGGVMVPLNEHHFVIDLIEALQAKVILVSKNYLGSINHSLLTASVCRSRNLDILGWVFNDRFMDYESEIVHWSGYKKLASIPFADQIDCNFITNQAQLIKTVLL